ncbi:class IIb bacteriocin, lactobin A/cerein 7B family [Flavobacterium amniphilum]|uniref:class IIb bacteriocin, lactobin A/cerein 7B family n=1 Tax=Flavobacterium amniphilum TaxID=1834035 RepID=UPI00202A82FB|nr:class IIb bacteriocin, lactobin A/cerein 7B family [Flavobacterium amniphilum]MCL9807416.1 class IIb bacteriocin, lactobin A/cerein 7B family [Flavobacterium amniphilum]
MKKQNLNGKLAFNKAVVVELNDTELYDVNGGATPLIASSGPCAGLASAVVGALVAWALD